MKTPKKWLQDWLGITALANKIVDGDIAVTGKIQPISYWGADISASEEHVKKGYES